MCHVNVVYIAAYTRKRDCLCNKYFKISYIYELGILITVKCVCCGRGLLYVCVSETLEIFHVFSIVYFVFSSFLHIIKYFYLKIKFINSS